MKFPYGNYPNYYGYRDPSKHSSTSTKRLCGSTIPALYQHLDPRLHALDSAWVQNKRVLDIGCNAGSISIQLARDAGAKSVVAVDRDGALITKAKKALALAHSRVGRVAREQNKDQDGNQVEGEVKIGNSLVPRFDTLKRIRCDSSSPSAVHDHVDAHYFPISLPLLLGTLPMSSHPPLECTSNFPYNIQFYQANIMDPSPLLNSRDFAQTPFEFDTILLLSVTKWIHLHEGDQGIRHLFESCFHWLSAGGHLVVEPQPWSSYTPHLREDGCSRFNSKEILQLRPIPSLTEKDSEAKGGEGRTFWEVLIQVGFVEGRVVYAGQGEKGFEQRPLWCFRKPLAVQAGGRSKRKMSDNE